MIKGVELRNNADAFHSQVQREIANTTVDCVEIVKLIGSSVKDACVVRSALGYYDLSFSLHDGFWGTNFQLDGACFALECYAEHFKTDGIPFAKRVALHHVTAKGVMHELKTTLFDHEVEIHYTDHEKHLEFIISWLPPRSKPMPYAVPGDKMTVFYGKPPNFELRHLPEFK
jgi:hypothetical protein